MNAIVQFYKRHWKLEVIWLVLTVLHLVIGGGWGLLVSLPAFIIAGYLLYCAFVENYDVD